MPYPAGATIPSGALYPGVGGGGSGISPPIDVPTFLTLDSRTTQTSLDPHLTGSAFDPHSTSLTTDNHETGVELDG